MSDNRIANATLAHLEVEASPGPYVYITKKGEKVEWPDPGEMGMIEAEKFLRALIDKPDSEAMLDWIGHEGYEKILADDWTLRQKNAVFADVFKHYESIFGTRGN